MSTTEIMELADLYYHNPYREGSHTHLVYADQKRAALLKAVEALAADAARYRHIKKTIQVGAVRTMLPLYRVHHWHGYEAVSDYEQLDDALDAARKETP